MKTKLLLAALVPTLFSINLNGQCSADAGEDKIICVTLLGVDTTEIGAENPVTGGMPPYTYTWYGKDVIAGIVRHASDFLNDTSIAKPSIVDFTENDLKLYLRITDSNGMVCTDSTLIRFSKFGLVLEDKFKRITQGDSVRLYPGVGGGIPPIRYSWSPDYKLSNSKIANPYASPDVDTAYVVTITDAGGCSAIDTDPFEVYVSPSSNIGELNPISVEIYPNPISSTSTLKIGNLRPGLTAKIFGVKGQLIRQFSIESTETELTKKSFENPGAYFLIVEHQNKIVFEQKLWVE